MKSASLGDSVVKDQKSSGIDRIVEGAGNHRMPLDTPLGSLPHSAVEHGMWTRICNQIERYRRETDSDENPNIVTIAYTQKLAEAAKQKGSPYLVPGIARELYARLQRAFSEVGYNLPDLGPKT